MGNSILEILKMAESVEPIMEKNGTKIVNYDDANVLAAEELIEGDRDIGVRTMNPDGTLARSRVRFAAVNEDSLYENRFRVVTEGKEKKVQIVVDRRAIRDQSTGRIYTARVPAYQIQRDDGKLKVEKILTVSDNEFIGEFVEKAGKKDMVEIMPLLDSAGLDISVTSIGI